MAKKKQWKPGQNQKGIKVGDVVEIIAISTTDAWHPYRHSLLFKKGIIIDIGPAVRTEGYEYKNWYSAKIQLLDHTKKMKENHISKAPKFNTIQLRKATVSDTLEPLQFTYIKDTNRNVNLDKINKELNGEIIEQEPLPEEHDKEGWFKLWKKNKPVMYKNNAASVPRWRNCATAFAFSVPGNQYMEFKMHESYFKG